jgi:hypothetical protein
MQVKILFHVKKVCYFIMFYIGYILDTIKGLSYYAYSELPAKN